MNYSTTSNKILETKLKLLKIYIYLFVCFAILEKKKIHHPVYVFIIFLLCLITRHLGTPFFADQQSN